MFGFLNENYKYNQFKMEQLYEERKRAKDLNKTECQRCGICCYTRPCNLVKDDINKIATYLNLTPEALFKEYLVVDTFRGNFVILPRRHEQSDIAGKYVPDDRTYDIDTPCVFFDDETKICKIHDAKPEGGKYHACWENKEKADYSWSEEDIINLGWDGEY